MVAITARFITPRRPVAAAAFGGLIDLWRIFFRPGRSMPVVCSECQTINRFSAKVCKGCDGKLPAFYTAGGDTAPSRAMGARARLASGARALKFRVPARWLTVACMAAVLATLFGAFGLWYAMYSSAAGRPVPAQRAPLAQGPAATPDVAPGVPASADPALIAESLKGLAPPPADLGSNAAVAAPSPMVRPAVRAPAQARPEPARGASAPPAEARAAAARRAGASPLARCSGLNFLAHAICVNDTCAQPASARSPQCAQALRQRRLDEARRNLTLLN